MTFGYFASGMVLRSKGEGSQSSKHIEGDRAAGVSLHLY